MNRRTLLLVLGCLAAFAAEQDPFFGLWKLDPQRTEQPTAGPPVPADLQWDIAPNGADGITFTLDATTSRNERQHIVSKLKFDGKDYAITGSPRPQATETVRRIDSRTLEITTKSEGKIIRQGRWTVSQDGKTLRVLSDGITRSGERSHSDEVFTRQ